MHYQHMNAVKIKESQLVKLELNQWIMEEKFKGIRCWYVKEFGEVQLITRGGEDITSNFPHISEVNWFPDYDTITLDCELFDPDQQDEVVSGWAMTISLDPDVCKNCVLMVFDIVYLRDTELINVPQIYRKELLGKIHLNGPFKLVPWYEATDHRKYYEHILSKNGEGIMLKNKMATYQPGRRTVKCWFKRKKRDTYDVVIVGFTEGKGKFYGLIGAIRVAQYVAGELREICNVSGMDDNTRRDITNNPGKYLGKVLEVLAMEQDENSLALIEPSYKCIRIDKRPEECTYVNGE